jgi:hypothetical protein
LCINCLCATTTAAGTTTGDSAGSPMPSEFPDTLKQSLGPREVRRCLVVLRFRWDAITIGPAETEQEE